MKTGGLFYLSLPGLHFVLLFGSYIGGISAYTFQKEV